MRELLWQEASRLMRLALEYRGAGNVERAFNTEADYRKVCEMLQNLER